MRKISGISFKAILVLFVVTMLGIAGHSAHAVPKNAAEFTRDLAGIAGLEKLSLGPVTAHGDWAETTATLHGEAITLVAFQPSGGAKPYIAVMPKTFKLTQFVPLPNGTPADGISFRDMAFVVVPKGDGRKGVSTGSLPPPVKTALAHHGNSVDFKDGISIFGEANVQSAGAIRTLLNSVGHSQMTLPLSAALPTGLFGVDMKKTTRLIKDTILEHLNLQMALPRLTIPGMPSMVSVKEARLVIVGEKKGTDINIVAGVTGNLDVDLHGTKHDFGFNILAVRGGQADQLQLNASTKNKISLPLIHPLDVLG